MAVKYMHQGDDLVEHRTREASFGAQCTNQSANFKLLHFFSRHAQSSCSNYTLMVEPIIQENVASSVSVEKKAICRPSKKKKELRLR